MKTKKKTLLKVNISKFSVRYAAYLCAICFLAYGIVRLQSLYGFKLKPFVEEGVISATLDNGQKVRSHPSVLKPNCKELT